MDFDVDGQQDFDGVGLPTSSDSQLDGVGPMEAKVRATYASMVQEDVTTGKNVNEFANFTHDKSLTCGHIPSSTCGQACAYGKGNGTTTCIPPLATPTIKLEQILRRLLNCFNLMIVEEAYLLLCGASRSYVEEIGVFLTFMSPEW
ncbi:hypothetical protein V6N13_137986 [Hibiscus sabdariffa]